MVETETQPLDTPRSLRARLGLHQDEVADRAQVSARTVTEIDAGRPVRIDSVRRVARVLGVSPGSLVDAMEREVQIRKSLRAFRLHRRRA